MFIFLGNDAQSSRVRGPKLTRCLSRCRAARLSAILLQLPCRHSGMFRMLIFNLHGSTNHNEIRAWKLNTGNDIEWVIASRPIHWVLPDHCRRPSWPARYSLQYALFNWAPVESFPASSIAKANADWAAPVRMPSAPHLTLHPRYLLGQSRFARSSGRSII